LCPPHEPVARPVEAQEAGVAHLLPGEPLLAPFEVFKLLPEFRPLFVEMDEAERGCVQIGDLKIVDADGLAEFVNQSLGLLEMAAKAAYHLFVKPAAAIGAPPDAE
jgi:hypothetical protein